MNALQAVSITLMKITLRNTATTSNDEFTASYTGIKSSLAMQHRTGDNINSIDKVTLETPLV